MTNQEFRDQIAKWQALLTAANVTQSDGKPIPDKFFHIFLGLGFSTFTKLVNGKESLRPVPPYIAKMVRYIDRLEPVPCCLAHRRWRTTISYFFRNDTR
ncbi:hypothetical protein A1QO_02540 [Vibrio genomosp. F10 str. ZF-129]|uniref:Uncharacterized protein n=1 Tax=Vibrio genomosp. F10 str. ZF-129 TaxID=1187848 RepID=A0A1E5BKJ2_9VIBR|nr:hypothetical protein [Vibrio genomosp. F10]OEE38275.1 hypothetical protein A1QO_02540 [Vibrio genomosp. F10 str. ZF-129]